MLIHVQCGGAVSLNNFGMGICLGCGKIIHIRVSNK
jgi:hypothetical protein